MKEQINFSDLSISLKILVVLGWIWLGLWTLIFLMGFIAGLGAGL